MLMGFIEYSSEIDGWILTDDGKKASKLALSPEIAKVVLTGLKLFPEVIRVVVALAAILEVRTVLGPEDSPKTELAQERQKFFVCPEDEPATEFSVFRSWIAMKNGEFRILQC